MRLSLSQSPTCCPRGDTRRAKTLPPAYLLHSPLLQLLLFAVSGEMWILVAECSFGATRMRVALQQRGWKEGWGISGGREGAPHCSHHHRRAPNDVACVAKVVLSQPEFSCSCDSPLARFPGALHNKVSSFTGAIDFKGRRRGWPQGRCDEVLMRCIHFLG